jgi:putative acetyltransferase
MKIVVDDLSSPEIARFLDEHVQEMRSITVRSRAWIWDFVRHEAPCLSGWR